MFRRTCTMRWAMAESGRMRALTRLLLKTAWVEAAVRGKAERAGVGYLSGSPPNRAAEPKRRNERMRWKYAICRHLPGRVGRRHSRKHAVLREFPNAVKRCHGMTCIDLGANVGEYTHKMALFAKRVIAFEPDPWCLIALRGNLAGFDNVTIENAAASTSDDKVILYRHPLFDNNSVGSAVGLA